MIDFSKASANEDKKPVGVTAEIKSSEIQPADPFDLVSAKAKFLEFQKGIDALEDEVKKFEIKKDDDAQQLTAVLGNANKLIKDLDTLQKHITDPHYRFYKSVLNFKNSFTDRIKSIVRIGKKTLSDYSYKKELERREAQRKAEEEMRKKQAELDRLAEEKGVEKVQLDEPIIEDKKTPIRSETATASSQIKWDFEVLDLEKVPRRYLRCQINKMAVNEAIGAGIREIEGLRIFETSKISIRSN